MPNIQHAVLTDPDVHEPKGAASAASGAFYVSDGAGSGSWKKRVTRLTAACSPSAVSANTTSNQTFTVTGVVQSTDEIISVVKPTAQTGLGIVGWRVTADNTVAITFMNNTGGGITPTAAETYTFFIWRN